MQQDLIQPTLLFLPGLLYLTVHVDDVFMVGREDKVRDFARRLKEDKKCIVEEKGPFRQGSKFHYLKRQFNLGSRHCDVRCDRTQYDSFEKEVDQYSRFYRKTPLDSNFGKRDETEELRGEGRSIVGRLMYMSSERQEAQYAIQRLARRMSKPTKQAMANAWRVVSYLFGTSGYGVRSPSYLPHASAWSFDRGQLLLSCSHCDCLCSIAFVPHIDVCFLFLVCY